jgi:uncharacterized protein (TIGR02145 family)
MKRKLMFCAMLFFVLVFPFVLKAQTTVTDIDGNVYRTVKIGTQIWMAENLKTTKYRNGDPIPNVTDNPQWISLKTGALCLYKNDEANKATYGCLYNWFAVADTRSIAPIGWHVPTDAELTILIDLLGGQVAAGGKLKEAGTAHWSGPNTGATNSSGFTALPGGSRGVSDGAFGNINSICNCWSSTANNATNAFNRYMGHNYAAAGRSYYDKKFGYSVRCIKD